MYSTELEFGHDFSTQNNMVVTDLPEVVIAADDGETLPDTTPLGTTAVEQAILSARDDQPSHDDHAQEDATVIPPSEKTPEPADSIKKPPTPPELPTAIGSPDEDPESSEPTSDTNETRPVENLADDLMWGRSLRANPSDGYYAASIDLDDKLTIMADGETSQEMQTDVTHQIALRNMLSEVGIDADERAYNDQSNARLTASFDDRIEAVSIPELEARAAELPPNDVVDYFMGKLESYTTYLASGQQPVNWPEAEAKGGLTSSNVANSMRNISETVGLYLDANRDMEGAEALRQRHQTWIEDTSSFLLSTEHIALAAPLINSSSEASAPALLDKVHEAMTALKESGREGEYRQLYSYLARTWQPQLAEQFIAQNEHLPTPLIPGSRRELITQGGLSILEEHYTENYPFEAQLVDGTPIELPYTKNEARTIIDYGLPTEHANSPVAERAVQYDNLDSVAKAAIETAWQAEDEGRLRVETMADYKRLALKPGDESHNPTLHTVVPRDGFNRIIHPYPDHHGLATSETEEVLDRPVVSARPVSSGYMVVPYNGLYMPQTTYRDAEANFYGPGAEQANAFWISGNPTLVVGAPDSIKYYKYDDPVGDGQLHRSARWTMFPVTYYQVEEKQRDIDSDEERPRYGP